MGKCDDHCGSHEHEHHHHHHGSEGCGCCCHSHEEDCHEHGDFASDLLELADEAWMCLLKDKIKEQILATNGKQIEELAKLVSDSNNSRWKLKMAKQNTVEDFRNKVHDFFNKGSK